MNAKPTMDHPEKPQVIPAPHQWGRGFHRRCQAREVSQFNKQRRLGRGDRGAHAPSRAVSDAPVADISEVGSARALNAARRARALPELGHRPIPLTSLPPTPTWCAKPRALLLNGCCAPITSLPRKKRRKSPVRPPRQPIPVPADFSYFHLVSPSFTCFHLVSVRGGVGGACSTHTKAARAVERQGCHGIFLSPFDRVEVCKSPALSQKPARVWQETWSAAAAGCRILYSIMAKKLDQPSAKKIGLTGTGRAPARAAVTPDAAYGYPRDFLENQFVYLVISPRAGGLTIGVNVNPVLQCTFQCLVLRD